MIDREAIATAAVGEWGRRGFAATTWQHLADATGVSARSLIRHFGTQQEILGVGVEAATARLAAELDGDHSERPLGRVLRDAVVASVSHDLAVRAVASDWAQVIAREPELRGWLASGYRAWIDTLATAVANRAPHIDQASCTAIASGYQAAAASALLDWALAGASEDPADRKSVV